MSHDGSDPSIRCTLPIQVWDNDKLITDLKAQCDIDLNVVPEGDFLRSSGLSIALGDAETPGIVTDFELTAHSLYGEGINRSETCFLRHDPPFMRLARSFTDQLTDSCLIWCVPDKEIHHNAEVFYGYLTNPLVLGNLNDAQIRELRGMAEEIHEQGNDDEIKKYGERMIAGIEEYLSTHTPSAEMECPLNTTINYQRGYVKLSVPPALK
ncbi:MAG: hypothetical protein Q7S00_02735, partial [bacterium]|nr:hypothetical protein [bacterium]